MRLGAIVVMLAVLTGAAGAASRAKQCQRACGGLIGACTARNQDVGGLKTACKAAVLQRCRKAGPTVCALPGPTCGNGMIDPGEQCDGTNLNGATCTSLGFTNGGTLSCTASCDFNLSGCKSQAFLATGQTTCWDSSGNVVPCGGTGQDGDKKTGAPLAYVDNGDGTVTDANTGLMWEKLSNGDGSVHDFNNIYTWDQVFSVHVAMLNGASFAGHTDWRVPNANELASIVNYQNPGPAVSTAFNTNCAPICTVLTCSCTQTNDYWSSSTYQYTPASGWSVNFFVGGVGPYGKTSSHYGRAVRGGS
jgi:Protein of unknown function (DUF1566)